MPFENAQTIPELNPDFPLGSDPIGEGDNHIRSIKTCLLSFYENEYFDVLRRLYAESGFTLVEGSFEKGGTVTLSTDVLLFEEDGQVYSWGGALPKVVPIASSPFTTGGIGPTAWISHSDVFINNRTTTIAQAQSESALIGMLYTLTDAGMALATVVDASDTGGYYYGTNTNGHKLRLTLPNGVVTDKNLLMVPGIGNDNSDQLSNLSTFQWKEFVVDDYYEYTSTVVISKANQSIKLSGKGELKGINSFFRIQGDLTPYGNITASSSKGGATITVADATGISVGDLICIHNQNASSYSIHRPYYFAGEYNTVISKSGNVLTLANRLIFDYTSLTNIKVFKMNLVDLTWDSVHFSTTGTSVYVLRIMFAKLQITGKPNVKALGTSACSAALSFEKCVGGTFDLGEVLNDTVLTDTQYGIVFVNSWNINGRVDLAWAYRHGIAMGGNADDASIPNNRIIIEPGSTISNNPASLIFAADMHGNTMNSYYKECNIVGDIGLAGENVGCPGCVITATRANYCIAFHEIVGGTINLTDVEIKIGTSFSFSGLIGFQSSAIALDVDKPFKLFVRNMKIEMYESITRIILIAFNQPVISSECEIDIDGIQFVGSTASLTSIMTVNRNGAGQRPKRVKLVNVPPLTTTQRYLELTGGGFTGCSVTLPSHVSPSIALTIAAGAYQSSSGGSPVGYAELNTPIYPSPPCANVIVENLAWSDPIKISAHMEFVNTTKIRAYIATPRSADVVAANTTKNVRITATYENISIP